MNCDSNHRLTLPGIGNSFIDIIKEHYKHLIKNEGKKLIVFDFNNSFNDFVNDFDVEVIDFSKDNVFLNIFDISPYYDVVSYLYPSKVEKFNRAIIKKSNQIIDIYKLIQDNTLSEEYTIIDKCIVEIYKNIKNPIMDDFYFCLEKMGTPSSKVILNAFKSTFKGPFNAFTDRTSIDINKDIIIFKLDIDIASIELLMNFILFDLVWNIISERKHKGIDTFVYYGKPNIVMPYKELSSFAKHICL